MSKKTDTFMTTLVLFSPSNPCYALMAGAWLRSWNKELEIQILYTEIELQTTKLVIEVMSEVHADIDELSQLSLSEVQSRKWDYFIYFFTADTSFSIPTILAQSKIGLSISNDSFHPAIDNQVREYRKLRDEIRDLIFDVYLKTMQGKEMLGADSCGVTCDL